MPLTLRVLSWNVHKCVGGVDRRHDPARIAAVIAHSQPDVVLLQEVAQNGSWYGGTPQVDVLGDALGFPHRSYFVNVRFGPRRGEYGNAILSRAPIVRTENVDLTLPGRKARSVLHAELRLTRSDGHTRILHVFNLHLGLSEKERREQLARFLDCGPIRSVHANTPLVVAGDFNDVWGSLGKRLLVPAGFHGPARPPKTFPAWAPVRALDSLFVRGNCELLSLTRPRSKGARTASDHLPLVADLRVWPH
ncbi:MAG: endonuclease/exonuclease/phosphatase family protein [Planctomycetes bacterium]|nr:endonuclease/exonuclease/phosphatase family protein [Planctomycetota bacterium]MCB9883858.1 endonuclease/exonuclease/phosphatase family protein [Planctomycetota bacterium]